jgi:hypothetical protein
MKDDPHRLLSTILIGNNLVNVGASAIATAITIGLVESHAVGIATGVMTLAILIFGEIFPKSIATRNNILIARLVDCHPQQHPDCPTGDISDLLDFHIILSDYSVFELYSQADRQDS